MTETGYVKFSCDWVNGDPVSVSVLDRLISWRDKLFERGVIGVYDTGIGFGNVSIRLGAGPEFIISGTQTGRIQQISPESFTVVKEYSFANNWVRCVGPVMASSEALTHAALYEADSAIKAVLHIHEHTLWQAQLDVAPTTAKQIEAGTPEMALAVKSMTAKYFPNSAGLIIMGGHQDGVLVFGKSCDEAGELIMRTLN